MTSLATLPSLLSRKAATALGLKQYFTGKPCKRGHFSPRLVRCRSCMKCGNEHFRIWYSKDPQSQRDRARKWQAANPEKKQAARRAWSARNPDKVRAQARRSGAKNPQKRRDRVREWKAKNPEWAAALKLVSTRNRRARMAKVLGSHSPADIKEIFKAQGCRCAYCKADLRGKKRHVDHIVPICLGGSNDKRNLQITCEDCNMRKGSTPPLEFARQEGMLL